MYSMDMTQIFWAVMSVAAAIITYLVIPYLKSKTTAQQQETIKDIVSVVVYAAQQIYPKEKNNDKKAYALNQIRTTLKQLNIEISDEEIATYIEGVLKDIKTSLAEDDKTW